MKKPVTVYFEDTLVTGIKPRDYGPLVFLRALVADREGLASHYDLKGSFDAYPLNGNARVLQQLSEVEGIRYPAVVTLDEDAIDAIIKHGGQTPAACVSGRKAALRTVTGNHATPIVFVRRNQETLLQALRDLAGPAGFPVLNESTWDAAIGGKDLVSRDRVLQAAASPPARPLRARLVNPEVSGTQAVADARFTVTYLLKHL